MITGAARRRADIAIGRTSVGIHATNEAFLDLLEDRYAGFMGCTATPDYEFDVELAPPTGETHDGDVRVFRRNGHWQLERGDFRAQWDPVGRRGRIRQSANPYAIDTVLRIVHTLVLAGEGGFLLHAASAVRDGRAVVFAGASGAGKTTISRLAPPEARVLSDEISYVRREADGYYAYGTPFAGELAASGENMRAPIQSVYLLAQGPENRVVTLGQPEAARGILANILFFAEDVKLVQAVFVSALEFAERVPVRRLTFFPDARVWEFMAN